MWTKVFVPKDSPMPEAYFAYNAESATGEQRADERLLKLAGTLRREIPVQYSRSSTYAFPIWAIVWESNPEWGEESP